VTIHLAHERRLHIRGGAATAAVATSRTAAATTAVPLVRGPVADDAIDGADARHGSLGACAFSKEPAKEPTAAMKETARVRRRLPHTRHGGTADELSSRATLAAAPGSRAFLAACCGRGGRKDYGIIKKKQLQCNWDNHQTSGTGITAAAAADDPAAFSTF